MARELVAQQGVRGLFTGLPAAILASVPKLSLSFATNETVTGTLLDRGFKEGPLVHITAGVCAGMVASTVTFPADVVMRSMQVASMSGNTYKGVLDCFRQLFAVNGAGVFFQGLTPELMKSVPVQATALVMNTWVLGQLGIKKHWDK